MGQISLFKVSHLMINIILVTLTFSYSYIWFPINADAAIAAACVNGLLGTFALYFLLVRPFDKPDIVTCFGVSIGSNKFWLVPLFLMLLTLMAAAASRFFGNEPVFGELPDRILLYIVVVPVVEELVFRGGLSRILTKYYGDFWGRYASVVIFAWVHSMPTLSDLVSLNTGIPLGPILLGAICEYMVKKTGRITLSIVTHAVCNGTVLIFALLDERWLDWLGFLYI
ncbi:MAG: hypothetical protein CMP10_07655 [Zetaproteobacteria bacterium]|nr:hypothetical protein [Pseudobdellovibrionaceae bacterium]